MSDETLTSTFTLMRGKFLRIASRFFPNEEDANDALQEAFCRLWPRREKITTRQDAEALAATTVRNIGIDAYRQRHKVKMLEIDAERDRAMTDPASEKMEREEQFMAVERIVETRLTAVQQTILRRKDFEGDSFEAIASDLGMQQAAVRMQLSRARKTIRECYRKLEER